MTYQVNLSKELYTLPSLEEAIEAFGDLCQVTFSNDQNYYRCSIDADEQTKDELLNYILEGSI